MSRRLITAISAVALGTSMAAWQVPASAGVQARAGTATQATATPSELSETTRLADRREVAAGTRAYSIGFEDGGFYANGWHITGEMGGVWTPPMKMLDGVWFGVDGQWLGAATKFTSGWGYTHYDLPSTTSGLQVQRTDFVPDGTRAALFGITVTNPGAARTTSLSVDAHSELMGQYPWGFSTTPNAKDNLPDSGSFDGKNLVFTDDGHLPGTPDHHYAALVGTAATPDSHALGQGFWGPRSGHVCTGTEPGAPAEPKPSQCDDGPFGRGTGGELTYSLSLPAHGSTTVWLAAAGSDAGTAQAQTELTRALADPAGQLAAKKAARAQLASMTQLSLPGNPLVQNAIDWGKQNIADLTQTADNLQIRWTNQGKQFPAALGTVAKASWIGAGYPDYPWIFGTDAEYTAFAAVSVGQFAAIEDHLRALRDVSDILNNRSGVVTHEVVSDGSIWYGHDSRQTDAKGVTTYDFNTDETVKFPSAVALLWRWTGDNAFRDEMYDFTVRNLHYVVNQLDADHDGWPEGLGNVERTGMGQEKLDNTVYFIRGLYDLADMARSKRDGATYAWATNLARMLNQRFDGTWWYQAAQQYADSLNDPGNVQSFQKHWIGQTPMEAELRIAGQSVPGLAPFDHGTAALAGREDPCYSGTPPFNPGLFHTACGGGPEGKGERVIFGLTTSIQSIGEGNYGRLGATQQGRYLQALAEPMFSEPATNGTPDEQPGAMPEIFPSPDQGANIDRCWTCRSMFMQAWGNYGTAWAVVHQWLGVQPDLGNQLVAFVPQVPDGQSTVQGTSIRLGAGTGDVTATHTGNVYQTVIDTQRVGARTVVIGHTLPRGTSPVTVVLDGRQVHNYTVRQTNRGTEVTIATTAGAHTLTITT
ncbi:glycogen debranching protein [Nostocoides sp. HKS02]|uniref:glycogen debranching protein n=1 Tax=Nostocoides sp. HKS02 TaxID=1813880 RepID=UPI0012B4ADEE|nr:glycogen debranching protein [Tetrasphaera sp. HKS02]QGN58986.1 glycogen debranching protein [Tetrasphaera sp. HKS02]